MKLFIVESKNVAYDEDASMVILANSIDKAINMAKQNWKFRENKKNIQFSTTEIDQSCEQIVDIFHYGD